MINSFEPSTDKHPWLNPLTNSQPLTDITQTDEAAVTGTLGPLLCSIGPHLAAVPTRCACVRDDVKVQDTSQTEAELLLQAKEQVLVVTHGRRQVGAICCLQGTVVTHLLRGPINIQRCFWNDMMSSLMRVSETYTMVWCCLLFPFIKLAVFEQLQDNQVSLNMHSTLTSS